MPAPAPTPPDLVPLERIQAHILVLRGIRVILDADLAALYGVSTKRLNEQVKRNARRFPEDFCFQLTQEEALKLENLRSQSATSSLQSIDKQERPANWSQFATGSSAGHGGRRYLPHAFTEHGAVQAANVLNSDTAIEMGVQVVRAFNHLRRLFADHRALAGKLADEERMHGDGVAQRSGATRRPWLRAKLAGCPAGRRVQQLEKRLGGHDAQIAAVIQAIRQLAGADAKRSSRKIGFHQGDR